jgi:2-desacetyl-2-hydroxyethyl bacteriochlorophyllide A dehydrogenase
MGMTVDGVMAEYVVVPNRRAVDLPKEVDDHAATVLEPFVVALHLLEQMKDRPGKVLVLGGGPIGVAAALVLANAGLEVTVAEPIPYRRHVSRELGIDSICSLDEIPETEFPVIVEASGHPSATDVIVDCARPGSTIILVGGPTEIPGGVILTRELEIRVAKGGRGLYREAIDMTVCGKIEPGRFVTHTFPVTETERAFRETMSQPDRIFRSVLDMSAW